VIIAAWHWPIYTANSQMISVAIFENGWGPDELAAKPGHVLDLNGRKNGLESQLVDILAGVTQDVNGKWAMAGSLGLPAYPCPGRGSYSYTAAPHGVDD
jgi:hypothetical protein